MTKFFREYQDTSSTTIAEAAAFLNRKPARQGSNQYLEEASTDVFDANFKRHPDHMNIMLRKKYEDLSPEEKEYHDEYSKRRDAANAERKSRVERPNPVKQGPAFTAKDNWGG
jgi:hypothetical protein